MSFEDAFSPAERVELAGVAEKTLDDVDRSRAERLIRGFRPIRGLRVYGWVILIAMTAFLTLTASAPRGGLVHLGGILLAVFTIPSLALYLHGYYRAITAWSDTRALQNAYDLPFVGARMIANAPGFAMRSGRHSRSTRPASCAYRRSVRSTG
ncbi:hypothetical protein GCM10025867_49320 (plasmid) [Frondihabitans sucicola]|uniref:DUF2868 domain-containing protein n=2 Tax=Frondihabitans sucicola TaxID=1268041 RepID=A0ABN6Y696_9MICO|nr:hypothetical protein GCM10025867_49320 [Frondihabitans sucicola]